MNLNFWSSFYVSKSLVNFNFSLNPHFVGLQVICKICTFAPENLEKNCRGVKIKAFTAECNQSVNPSKRDTNDGSPRV